MKRAIFSLRDVVAVIGVLVSFTISASRWDFGALTDADVTNLNADASAWTYDSNNNRWSNANAISNTTLTAYGVLISITKGLLITTESSDEIRIDAKKKSLTLNKSAARITIPGLMAGQTVTFVSQCSSKSVARNLEVTNFNCESGFDPYMSGDGSVTSKGTVKEDGDITVNATGGMYLYSIEVSDGNSGEDTPPAGPDHSVGMDVNADQMMLRTTSGDLKFYNTDQISEVTIDKTTGTVNVNAKSGEWNDEFTRNIAGITFSQEAATGTEGEITNGGVNITEAKGWLESCYVKWDLFSGASTYRVYIKGGKYSDFTQLDRELVRDYGSYGRADMVGLSDGLYSLKVVPVINGAESENDSSVASGLNVTAHNRSGFAFLNDFEPGAYKANGELKDNAQVIYVTAETAKTVTCTIKYDKAEQVFTGIQDILYAYQKGTETRPLAVRIVGLIKDTDLDRMGSSSEGLQIKGKGAYSPMPITIEGIGDDATTWGFGFLIRNCSGVEFRNFANMLCMDDALSFDTDNNHCWVHHMDFFYGNAGGDSDQAKGDGTVDIKGDSQLMTIASNRFHDCGKTSLCGMKSESGPNYIDYHHNWFDHSDSRNPRVRTMSVHVWNNYFDGVSKYGVGATTAASVFVESNFYRASRNPMLISLQGSDIVNDPKGTFSGETGGIIKSFGNVYADKGSGNNYTPVTYQMNPVQFDCYQVENRDDKVPSDVKTLSGGNTYNNFDTNPQVMYEYTADDAAGIPSIVTGFYGAGRINHGDFQWDMNYTGSEKDYSVISALKSALRDYKSPLVGIFE